MPSEPCWFISEELLDEIEEAVKLGYPPWKTAEMLGINKSTWYQWLKIGECTVKRQKPPVTVSAKRKVLCVRLYKMIAALRLKLIKMHLKNINRQAMPNEKNGYEGDAKLSCWMLEKLDPETFGVAQKVEHTLRQSDETGIPTIKETVQFLALQRKKALESGDVIEGDVISDD